MDHYVNFCVNLDDRDREGKPKVVKTPKEMLTIYRDDVVHLSVSIIENGVEKELSNHKLWNETVQLEEELKRQSKAH